MSSRAKPWVLGISSGFHNGAACLCHGTEIAVAIQEERLSRVKRGALARRGVPRCIQYCLEATGKTIESIDLVVECRIDPPGSEERRGKWAQNILPAHIPEIVEIPHHFGHAVSAFGTS